MIIMDTDWSSSSSCLHLWLRPSCDCYGLSGVQWVVGKWCLTQYLRPQTRPATPCLFSRENQQEEERDFFCLWGICSHNGDSSCTQGMGRGKRGREGGREGERDKVRNDGNNFGSCFFPSSPTPPQKKYIYIWYPLFSKMSSSSPPK